MNVGITRVLDTSCEAARIHGLSLRGSTRWRFVRPTVDRGCAGDVVDRSFIDPQGSRRMIVVSRSQLDSSLARRAQSLFHVKQI